jgi:hypothetical protein
VVLEVTAINPDEKDSEKRVLFNDKKDYWEIGKDLEGRMRYGAWQIKEIVDLTLQPMQTQKEKYLIHFDTDIERVEVEATLSYYISGGKGDVVYSTKKMLEYDLE